MRRLLIACVVLFLSISTAAAALLPRKEPPPSWTKLSPDRLKQAVPREDTKEPEWEISDATEVQLDGKACKFEDVPKGAEITLLEVASDKKAILKIHFRSKK